MSNTTEDRPQAPEARDARIARALHIRLRHIHDELRDLEAQRQEAYAIADSCIRDFDELTEQRFRLKRALWQVEQRLSEAASKNREEVMA